MEKSTNTKAIVKGSTTTAAEVISFDVDADALRCPRCLQLLVPPVLQCAAGHLICSSCHDSLPDKNNCVSCFIKTFIPTSYSRCHAVEGILRSVRVACPNAIHGCTAGKMLYHEKAEHDKICLGKAGSGSLTRQVVKMGPCGGGEGDVKEIDVLGINRIVKVVVWHRASAVDAMSVLYERDGREESTDKWGIPAGGTEPLEICLEPDEYLTAVKGHVGDHQGRFCVKSLTFIGNRRTFGPYGEEQGALFELPAAGGRIVGFHGRSGSYLDALGTYVKMVV